ncbi:CIA30 family protein [Algoriphagus aquimarinus]|uniref:Complex I intermediate-associated protein 30 (CIA30) n=1 Tax=Algoriphagus aquimarinus TaxID=237018 RepID=A0A1I1BR69_9BACT|nr:CIA30 family protein [Algoriphagus aquimarinus]SFB51218.1 Complex I intermediate-associated protein 30 (CIA30) [Algoriphagus aquimarinus]|tara:strand:- start:105899 stop:106399 length:501 start_codon:yes stop_codon:yes gene_type:complete
MSLLSSSIILYQFNKNSPTSDWRIVDDGVMGGRSSGDFHINESGNGVFEGVVSLANNGGFSSVRYRKTFQIQSLKNIRIHLKGDGSIYQFRVKAYSSDRHSYISEFQTSGEWETIEIKLSDMHPAYRGRKLSIANFDQDQLEEMAFLIGNKKEQEFHLEIKSIQLF